MAYKALYRTYRPTTFEEVVGQKHIVLTLQNAIMNNKIAHAYLFTGPRGTGKTTVAKLVAKAVNCINPDQKPCNQCDHCISINKGIHPDIVEIDAASNNGVDEIRDLIERVKYSPIEAKYKVYIIDEVHMLSAGAFNALLKTLEEPPSHVIFILATTEPHKVLPTIISRCQRFDFSKVPHKEIASRVEEVLNTEKIEYDKEVVRLISLLAEGGLRDALSILEQVIAYGQNKLIAKHVNEIYGITTVAEKIDLLNAVFSQDAVLVLEKVRKINEKSYDIKRLTSDLIDILKEAVIYSFTNDESLLQILTLEETQSITNRLKQQDLIALIDILIDTIEKYRNATNIHSYFEVCLLKMMGTIEIDELSSTKPNTLPKIDLRENIEKVETTLEQKVIEQPELINQDEPFNEVVEQELLPELELKTEPEAIVEVIENQDSESFLVETQLQIDNILAFMTAANKESRQQDTLRWKALQELSHELQWAKSARLLLPSEIVASGDDFILLAFMHPENVKAVNDPNNKVGLSQLTNQLLGVSKEVFAITRKAADEAIEIFKVRQVNGTLPKPATIVKEKPKETKKSKEPSLKEQVSSLFGEDIPFITED